MTRNFWIEVIKDEEFDTRFRIALRPFRYRSAPATIGKLDFATQRSFGSEGKLFGGRGQFLETS
jgi:hypothetical protein